MKNIRAKSIDFSRVKLSPEEGFVFSRIEGATSVKELVALTGLDEARVLEIVGRLRGEGAVEIEGEPEAAAPPPPPPPVEAEAAPVPDEPEAAEDAPAEETPEELAREATEERDYRKIYADVFASMTRDERVVAAASAEGARLLALCLDAEPQVIEAALTSSNVTLACARLVAAHHRTHIGLEHVAKRSDFVGDAMVQRRLFRNPQVPGTILNRIINPKPMIEVYKIGIDREIPERTRLMTREVLRKKFMVASSDERAALLMKTEGRCLILLVNCSLDAHATQILCGKQTYSLVFIQNLARWSATPPVLLGHLLKMAVVRNNPGLRKMLLKHPNTPSDMKRGG